MYASPKIDKFNDYSDCLNSRFIGQVHEALARLVPDSWKLPQAKIKSLFIKRMNAYCADESISSVQGLHRIRALLVHQFGQMHQITALRLNPPTAGQVHERGASGRGTRWSMIGKVTPCARIIGPTTVEEEERS
jgi:hypothetical protein